MGNEFLNELKFYRKTNKKREKCKHFNSLEEICILHNINEYFEC